MYMKKIFTIIAVAATVVATASCSKTDELSGTKNKITTINASIDDGTKAEANLADGTKVTLTDNTTTMGVTWKTGDEMFVFDGDNNSSTNTAFTYAGTDGAASGPFTGTFSSTNGHNIYAIAGTSSSSFQPAVNGSIIDLKNITSSVINTVESCVYNYSVMYAGAVYASDAIPHLTFSNAMAAVKLTLPNTSATFMVIKGYSADASIRNKATMTISGGASPVISWSKSGEYGTRTMGTWLTEYTFSAAKKIYLMMLPQASSKGMIITFTAGGEGASATAVNYVMLTDATKKIESGKYYRIPSTSVLTGAVLSVNSQTDASDFWYCNVNPTAGNLYNRLTALNGTTRNITVVIDGFNQVPAKLEGCTRLQTFVDNDCPSIEGAMFKGCTNLQNVSIAGTTYIGTSAFEGCSSLTSINLPSATTLTDSAFKDCPALTKVTFNSIITSFSWSSLNVFGGTTVPANIDLVLKTGQKDDGGATITGNTFSGVTLNHITFA